MEYLAGPYPSPWQAPLITYMPVNSAVYHMTVNKDYLYEKFHFLFVN